MAALSNSASALSQSFISLSPFAPTKRNTPSSSFVKDARHGYIRTTRSTEPKAFFAILTNNGRNRTTFYCIGSSTVLNMPGIFDIFREIGFTEKEAEALFQKNPYLELASPESIRKRVIALQTAGIMDFTLCRMITKRPDVLMSQEMDPFVEFLQENLEAILPRKIERLLAVTEPHNFADFAEKLELLLEHGVLREELAPLLNRINLRAFCCESVEDMTDTLTFLKEYRISAEWIVRRPLLLTLDLKTQIEPRVAFFTEFGGGRDKATELLSKFPAILAYTVDHLQSHAEFWRSAGLSDEKFFKIALIYPNVFSVSKDDKLKQRVDFLKQCGLDSEDMCKFLTKAPLFLSLSWKSNLSKKLGLLVKLGYKNKTRELALALGAATRTSCRNMQLVISIYLSYGLSFDDILVMSKKHPQVLQYNSVSLEKKMEYLIQGIGRDIGELLSFPAFLGYRLDERIKHRYEMKKDTRGEGMSLIKLLSVSSENFASKKQRLSQADVKN